MKMTVQPFSNQGDQIELYIGQSNIFNIQENIFYQENTKNGLAEYLNSLPGSIPQNEFIGPKFELVI